ncbi:MAG: PP2C family protein-serine/threonine phosphatase [Ilumatobacteraceae bacterium]
MGASADDELWFVPGFRELASASDVLAGALDASHLLPPDRVEDLVRQAGRSVGATDVSMWVIDYGQATLVPIGDHGDDSAGGRGATLAVASTTAGRAFARAEAIESAEPDAHRWIPLLDGTERLGVIRFAFPGPLTDVDRRRVDALASLAGELLVGKREHTDHYTLRRRRREMNLAAEMQWQQLPPLESATPSAEVAGFVEPAYGVGGDGFDYSLNDDVLDLVIYDAVGHGLHAALLSTLTIASLRHARRCRLDLAARLDAADEAIAAEFRGDFVTAQVAQLSTTTGSLTWVNAGHPPPILVRDGGVVGELACEPRPPIGFHRLQTSSTVVATVQLQPGDRVLFYTDGLVEGGRRGGSRFGFDRLADLLGRTDAEGLGCAETIRRLGHSVLEHAAFELHDDATMLLVEWRGMPVRSPVVVP